MRRRFLRFLATFTFRYAWLMLPLVLLVTGLALWQANRMDFDTSMVAFLPPTARQEQAVGEIISDYRKLEPVLVTIRARRSVGETELIGVAQEAARLLDNPSFFARPVYKVDELARSYYGSLSTTRLLQLLPPGEWDELPRLLADRLVKLKYYHLNALLPPRIQRSIEGDPLGALETIRARLAGGRGPTRLETRDGYFLSADGRTIRLLLYPLLSPEIAREALDTIGFLNDSRDFLLRRHAPWRDLFEIEFTGSLVDTANQLRRLRDDQQLILAFTAPLAMLLILLVFRKVEAIIFIMLPPALGLTWTLGLATRAFGGISFVTAAFLLIILAIGLQYSVHLYHRFVIELYRNHNYYRALNRSYVETGRGILASAVIVALLFFALLVTALVTSLPSANSWRGLLHLLRDTRGIAQLGLIAGLGILCNLFACLLALPLMAAIKAALARNQVKPVPLYRFRLDRLFDPAIDTPRATLGILLLASVYFGHQARQLDFYPGFASVSPFFYRTPPAEIPSDPADAPRPGRPIIAIVHGKTWQEALEHNDRLYDNLAALEGDYNILSFESLRTVLPSLRTQQAALDRLNKLDLTDYRARLTATCEAAGLKPAVAENFLATLAQLKQDAAHPEYINYRPDASESLISAVQRYITHKSDQDLYYVATPIYPHASGFAPRRLTSLSAALGQGLDGLTLIGDPLIERDLSHMFKINLALMILISILIISSALLLHYRSLRRALLTFLPVLAELVWLCGLMALAGVQLHFFTLLALPLMLSLALDNALQLTQYYCDRQPCSVRHAMRSLGRVTILTAGLTAILLGTFALASYPGVRDFGAEILLGALAAVGGTVMLLPALLQLFGQNQPVLPTLLPENETT